MERVIMTDITELEGRITAALERIGSGVQALSAVPPEPEAAPVDEGEIARLREALDIEKEANAQLEELPIMEPRAKSRFNPKQFESYVSAQIGYRIAGSPSLGHSPGCAAVAQRCGLGIGARA